ncbi:hypothetical protein AAG570_012451 [Ranatra chinensis]|uniref:Uncharacterized protein n=1 Tax=Ranatra chinensis TaxID=642074 RepID=A0ABD0YDW7_9HEMI
MASKRRNMFQKNRTQETAENGHLLSQRTETHLSQLLQRLKLFGLKALEEKSSTFNPSVKFMGHILSGKRIRPDPEKVLSDESVEFTDHKVGEVHDHGGHEETVVKGACPPVPRLLPEIRHNCGCLEIHARAHLTMPGHPRHHRIIDYTAGSKEMRLFSG